MIKENQERDQVIVGLATNVNVLTKMFTESQTKKVNMVEDVQPISNEDFEEANYVNNSQEGIKGNNTKVKDNKINGGLTRNGKVTNSGEMTKAAQIKMQMRDLSREQNPKQKGSLPSDTIVNPKGSGSGPTSHVMEITTRSGKVLQGGSEQVVEVEECEHEVEVEEPSVVKVEKVPEELKVQQESREEVKEKQAGLGMPMPTSMRLQMTDRSIKKPVGIVDDVLVKMGKFHLPADFVILDCAVDKEIPIILGRPFLDIGRALMDSEWNEIKFRAIDEEVTFQASKGMKLRHEYESISVIDVVDEVENAVEMNMEEQCLGEALAAILVNFDGEDMEGYI
uniref:Reverse transcriptase domain-containing protein n=1 Tax=Nicotiana tabacum TaxID=4097 RepID=A0A1S4BHC6_TOBAC|nr:PREDICTED: uncharacterized protein LOC107808262 [Nicotiana tabacum]